MVTDNITIMLMIDYNIAQVMKKKKTTNTKKKMLLENTANTMKIKKKR